jgi:hydrogenase/urease accessory protein HupE
MRRLRAGTGWSAVLLAPALLLALPAALAAHDAGITSVARVHLAQTGERRYVLSVLDRGVPPLESSAGLLPGHCRALLDDPRARAGSGVAFECIRPLNFDDALTLPWGLGVAAVATWADGSSASAYFPADGRTATVRLGELRAAAPSGLRLAERYVALGIEHILFGIDHLLFVLGLFLLAPTFRSLVLTVTAFTVAHSLTLAATVLGVASVDTGAVEAAIALSIVFLAREVVTGRRGASHLAHRQPWIVAFGFGLLHGFGFASALGGIGLRTADIPAALLSFNAGVEVGQLGVIAVLLAGRGLVRRTPLGTPIRETALGYVLGAVATVWFIDRLPRIWTA